MASALTHPGTGRVRGGRGKKGIAHHRKELRMLVTVGELGRTAEQIAECGELCRDFELDDLAIEAAHETPLQHVRQGQEHAAIGRPEMHGERAERRGQRHMQADGAAVAPGVAQLMVR